MNNDLISRKAAINALWKALYEYENKTEKQFQESEDLDVGDWIEHRNFVQNMNDIDRQTILNLPSAHPEIVRCKERADYDTSWTPYSAPDKHYCPTMDSFMSEDDYCSFAERRTNETD